MITYHLRHIEFKHVHPFPFPTRQAAESFRATIDAENDYIIYEKIQKIETEDEKEERENREFENDLLEDFIETERDSIQL